MLLRSSSVAGCGSLSSRPTLPMPPPLPEPPDGVAWSAYWAPTAAEKALGNVSVLRYGMLAGN